MPGLRVWVKTVLEYQSEELHCEISVWRVLTVALFVAPEGPARFLS